MRLAVAAALLATAACGQPQPPRKPRVVPTTTPPTPPPTTASTTAPPTTAAPTTTTAVRVRVTAPRPPVTDPPEGMQGAQTARASWYGSESGSRTANGDAFDGSSLTYAHLRHAFGTMTRFCYEGRCVVARCNDRGPAAWTGKTFDLSRAAFAAIAPLGAGVVTVTWEAA